MALLTTTINWQPSATIRAVYDTIRHAPTGNNFIQRVNKSAYGALHEISLRANAWEWSQEDDLYAFYAARLGGWESFSMFDPDPNTNKLWADVYLGTHSGVAATYDILGQSVRWYNYISNPYMIYGATPTDWYLYEGGTGDGTLTKDTPGYGGTSYCAKVAVVTAGSDISHISLRQRYLYLEAGTDYTLQFYHKASAGRSIWVKVTEVADDYTVLMSPTEVTSSISWTYAPITFTTPAHATSPVECLIDFMCGNWTAGDAMYIDNVRLCRSNDGTAAWLLSGTQTTLVTIGGVNSQLFRPLIATGTDGCDQLYITDTATGVIKASFYGQRYFPYCVFKDSGLSRELFTAQLYRTGVTIQEVRS